MNLNLPTFFFQTSGYGIQSLKTIAEGALARWNQVGIGPARDHGFFLIRNPTTAGSLCPSQDGINEVHFALTFCGLAWGDVVGLTTRWPIDGVIAVEVDVTFNSLIPIDAYPGRLRLPLDFFRLALHEFGHAIGLAHPDQNGQNVTAIMNSQIGVVDRLQADDIAGAGAIGWYPGGGGVDVAIHNVQTGNWYVGRSNGLRFAVEQWASRFGDRGTDAERVYPADFDGDGKVDVAVHDRQRGDWWIGRSTGGSFTPELWASNFGNRGPTLEEVFVADFTGDGRADVAVHDLQTGEWYVGRSTGAAFQIERWATSFGNRGSAAEEVFVGDFDGDGKADIAIHDRRTGDWYIARSTGVGFTIEHWASRFGNRGATAEEVFVADFTGDGKADIAIHDRVSGDWYVGRSTGASFVIESWASRFGNRGDAEGIFVGDFTGDGRADIAIHDRSGGNWYVGRSTGVSFAIEVWAARFGNLGPTAEEVIVGDFTGDGKADIAIHDLRSGNWFVGRSTGIGFALESWASRFGNQGTTAESVFVGKFTGR